MREILFRAKTKSTDNPEWVEGYYTFDGTHWIDHKLAIECPEYGWGSSPINPETLCEFTGIKDRNGARIFEGDIVRCTYYGDIRSNRAVVFEDGEFLLESNGDYISVALYEKEVIGNIYDNPELLKGESK